MNRPGSITILVLLWSLPEWSDHQTISPQTEGGVNCTFDSGMCGYTNGSAGSLRWAWSHDKYIRGIQRDHTTGQGSFLYLTTNTIGSVSLAKSSVLTPALTFDGWVCLSFYYWIIGKTYYNIILVWLVPGHALTSITDAHTEVLKVFGRGMTRWERGNVSIDVTANDTIAFVSTKTGFFDYVAIDDVNVRQGNCTQGSGGAVGEPDVTQSQPQDTGSRTYAPKTNPGVPGTKSSTTATRPPNAERQKSPGGVSAADDGSSAQGPSGSSPSMTSSDVATISVVIGVALVVIATIVISAALLKRQIASVLNRPGDPPSLRLDEVPQ